MFCIVKTICHYGHKKQTKKLCNGKNLENFNKAIDEDVGEDNSQVLIGKFSSVTI